MQPTLQLDCVLVPLVAFDDEGTRLGMGGGGHWFCRGQRSAAIGSL